MFRNLIWTTTFGESTNKQINGDAPWSTLPRDAYILSFVHCDGDELDTYEHAEVEDARYHMNLFSDSDAKAYDHIKLYRRDYIGHIDALLEPRMIKAHRRKLWAICLAAAVSLEEWKNQAKIKD